MAITVGLEPSFEHDANGMILADMQAAKRVADKLNEVIIFRSTGPWAKRWIEWGYPTKNFHVKGKSSDWGPQAGLVPYDGTYSKVGYDAKRALKGTEANNDGLKSKFASKQHLKLTRAQIEVQISKPEGGPPRNAILRQQPVPGTDDLFLVTQRSGDRKEFVFRAVRTAGGDYQIWVYRENQGTDLKKLTFDRPTPFEVMTSNEEGTDMPMTGDYDLLAVCPSWADYGSTSVRDIAKPGIQLAGRGGLQPGLTFHAGHGMDRVLDPALQTGAPRNKVRVPNVPSTQSEHVDMGNLTPRILRCINELNAEMGATGKRGAFRRVHHNAESHRNAMFGALTSTDMETKKDGEKYGDGFPFTVFQPPAVARAPSTQRYGDVCTIETLTEFKTYAGHLHEAGYFVPRNWSWGMSIRDGVTPGRG